MAPPLTYFSTALTEEANQQSVDRSDIQDGTVSIKYPSFCHIMYQGDCQNDRLLRTVRIKEEKVVFRGALVFQLVVA